jgi:hypothetical protein
MTGTSFPLVGVEMARHMQRRILFSALWSFLVIFGITFVSNWTTVQLAYVPP